MLSWAHCAGINIDMRSSFIIVTFKPRASKIAANEAAVIPLPKRRNHATCDNWLPYKNLIDRDENMIIQQDGKVVYSKMDY